MLNMTQRPLLGFDFSTDELSKTYLKKFPIMRKLSAINENL